MFVHVEASVTLAISTALSCGFDSLFNAGSACIDRSVEASAAPNDPGCKAAGPLVTPLASPCPYSPPSLRKPNLKVQVRPTLPNSFAPPLAGCCCEGAVMYFLLGLRILLSRPLPERLRCRPQPNGSSRSHRWRAGRSARPAGRPGLRCRGVNDVFRRACSNASDVALQKSIEVLVQRCLLLVRERNSKSDLGMPTLVDLHAANLFAGAAEGATGRDVGPSDTAFLNTLGRRCCSRHQARQHVLGRGLIR